MMETKHCPCCGETKPVSEFYKARTNKDGYTYHCKVCYKKYYQVNKDRIAVQMKEYYQVNKDRIAVQKKEYSQVNKDRIAVQKREYRQTNKDRIAVRMREYKQTNKDKANSAAAKRRATKLQATPAWSDLEAVTELYTCAQAFRVYTGLEYHVDHIVPLHSKLVCGLHVPANLQLLEARENISKGNRFWPDMP